MKNYPVPYGADRLKAPISTVRGVSPKIISVDTVEYLLDTAFRMSTSVESADELVRLYKSDKPEYDRRKSRLEGFIVGAFTKRNAESCTTYVPLIVLDIDKINDEVSTDWLFSEVCEIEYTFAAVRSPSGHGIRILVWSDHTHEQHGAAYDAITKLYSERLKLPTDKEQKEGEHLDTSAKAFPRFWYYNCQHNHNYSNLESKTFFLAPSATASDIQVTVLDIAPRQNVTPQYKTDEPLTDAQRIEIVELAMATRRIPNGRNNKTFHFAALATEHGVSPAAILQHCQGFVEDDFTEKEMSATVESAINRTSKKFEDRQIIKFANLKAGVNTPVVSSKIKALKTPVASVNAPSVSSAATGENAQTEKEAKPLKINYQTDRFHEPKRNENKFLVMRDYLFDRYDFRYNTVSNKVEISFADAKHYQPFNKNGLLCELLEFGMTNPGSNLDAFLGNLQFCPEYDVFQEYFSTLPAWDGHDYIKDLASYVEAIDEQGSENNAWHLAMFRKALIRNVCCALGVWVNKQCIVYYSGVGAQNVGKTSFIEYLMPPSLKEYYKQGFENPENKDSQFSLAQNMIINFDELGGMSKYEINKLKAIFTIPTIKQRKPFGTEPAIFPRKASFWATTNKDEFLEDETGTVRWVVIRVKSINHDNGGTEGYKKVDINKVWAQAYHLFKNSELKDFQLSAEELQKSEETNKSYQNVSIEHELLIKWFEPDPDKQHANFRTASDLKIALESLVKGSENVAIQLRDVMIGKALGKLKIEKCSVRNKRYNTPVKGYYLKQTTPELNPLSMPSILPDAF